MKKYFGLIIILISVGYSFGQSSLLKGKLIDVETNVPLPYETIEIYRLQKGTIADNKGVFELSVNSQNQSIDTVGFS